MPHRIAPLALALMLAAACGDDPTVAPDAGAPDARISPFMATARTSRGGSAGP